MNRRGVACAVALIVCGLGLLAAEASASYLRCYAVVHKNDTSAQWNGARTNMDIHNGQIGTTDAQNGYFVADALWVYDVWNGWSASNNQWVEVGYTRGWEDDSNPGNNDVLTLYWTEQMWVEGIGYQYYEHKIRTSIAAGETYWGKILYLGGGDAGYAQWGVYIDGDPADSQWWYSESQAHDHAHNLFCGLENTASSGKLGSSSNHVEMKAVNKSSNGGTSWQTWAGDGLSETVDSGSTYHCHGHWQSDDPTTANWQNYRNW